MTGTSDASEGRATGHNAARRPGDLRLLWLIARRGARESLRDRMTIVVSLVFALGLPLALLLTAVRFQIAASGPDDAAALGGSLVTYLFLLGLAPTTGAIGIACGQFAGEKESGSLAPLLASPASNVAVFGGKILAALLPTLLFAALADLTYLIGLAIGYGPGRLRLLPPALAALLIALVPATALFSATVASLVSSRVRTFNTAQQISGLVLTPVNGLLVVAIFATQRAGALGLGAVVAALCALDLLLIVVGAATWRREEVLARR
jgi:ABC-type Na+ efflux pump permease subunit